MKVTLKNDFKIVARNKCNNAKVQSLSFTSIKNIPIRDKLIKENVNFIHLLTLLQKLGNTFSKEDFKKINKQVSVLSKKYNKDNTPDLMKLGESKSQDLLDLIKSSGIKTKTEDGIIKYSDEINKINSQIRKKIKKVRMQQVAIREALKRHNPSGILTNAPTLGDWFKGFDKSPQLTIPATSLFEHPIDKTLFLTGQYTEKELKLIKKKTLKLNKIPESELIKEKIKILKELTSVLNKPNQYLYGAFTNIELKKIRNLSLNYSAYNQELIQRGIYNKNVEAVILNSSANLSDKKIGENINGYGFIIKKSNTYDRELKSEYPSLIVFSNISSKKTIKNIKIDKDFENEITKFKEDYETFCNSASIIDNNLQAKISSFNENAKSILGKEKNLVISEISFSMLNKKLAELFISEIPKPLKNDDILKVIDNDDVFPLIIDYKNHDSKRYPNGARDVASSLLHLFFQNKCSSIFVKALAINSNRSPVGLYYRYGFEPVSHTHTQIKQGLANPLGFDYKEPVWMYLPSNSILENVVKKEEPLKEIFDYGN